MRIDDLNYELPTSAIATKPAEPRDHSRLMVYHRGTGAVEHRRFFDLPEYLAPGDLLVVNDSKVLPAKLMLHKETGALIPGLYLREMALGTWEVMLRSRGKLRAGMMLTNAGATGAANLVRFTVLQRGIEKGHWIVEVSPQLPARELLEHIGHVPLPPYIETQRGHETSKNRTYDEAADRRWYQTVYADGGKAGSLAAPTAGLHFTAELLERIRSRGTRLEHVTLHVGLGTFLPVEAATLEDHPMHEEEYTVPEETIRAIRELRQANMAPPHEKQRIVVVGTTAARTLESTADQIMRPSDPPCELRGRTDLLIQPGYNFQITDVLITNFHLPRSTLLALVGAMVGVEKLKELYHAAISEGYRFYSYGDAMMIL